MEEVALVDEPTAAAIGCGLRPGSRVLVVDLGGGTIDLSLVALEGGKGEPLRSPSCCASRAAASRRAVRPCAAPG